MGLKKYEIITVGSDKRVRALRSWAVGDRYVNIGDVGGIVYDEKTLSQDGLCWLFRGNFGFSGARIGGDSIVDVGEFTNPNPKPNVTIDGASQVVGTSLLFNTEVGVSPTVLNALYFEQGAIDYTIGQKPTPKGSSNHIRTKSPIFMGGSLKIAMAVPGYRVIAIVMNKDGNVTTTTANAASGVDVVLHVPTGQCCHLQITKDPLTAIVPADATTAALTATLPLESFILIRDSRLELTDTGTVTQPHIINPTGNGQGGETEIVDSSVSIFKQGNAARTTSLVTKMNGSTMTADVTPFALSLVGTYNNVKNIAASGSLNYRSLPGAYTIIQATDCNDFAVSPTIFPGLAAAQTANQPFIFQGCNVPDGRFYHHTQIANTYKNIDFALAQTDLGKATANANVSLVSSEVEGMYRLYANDFGALVESHDSVKSLNIASADLPTSYGTTIYKDAYLNGLFDIAGTNVFGHKVRSHPMAQTLNVAPRAVQGIFNTITVGGTITGVTANANRVCVPIPFRVNGAKGLTINCPTGVEGSIVLTDINGVIKGLTTLASGESSVPAAQLVNTNAYLYFGKNGGGAITPEDLAGVTVTVYNGCKIVNTGSTAVNMNGNIRVEDNATLVNASVTGSGYFGGNSVVYYNPAVWASLDFNGTVYMKDNAVFAPSALTGANALVRMEGNAKFTGSVDVASTNLSFIMRDNAVIEGKANTRSGVVMSGNSKVTATGQIMAASRGVLVMEENASIEANTTVIGAITLSGNYKGNVVKTWTGKRVIDSVNAPEYDNNVKTQYDF